MMTTKPVNWFKTEKQVREVKECEELRELGKSMLERQLQPVIARTNGVLVAGHRRLQAAIMVGKPTLDVVITDEDLSESQVRQIQLCENIHREDLTGYEKWLACSELMCMNPAWQQKDLAKAIHISEKMVTVNLSPSHCTAEWQDALKAGKVGISDCYAASKLPAKEQAGLLALKLSGASRDQIEHAGRKSRNGKRESVKLSRVKIKMPNGAMVTVSGKELSMTGVVEILSDTLKEARRAAEQYDVKTFQSMMRDRARAG